MIGNMWESLRGPLSPMTRVTFGSLYAGPLVSHLYVVVQSEYNVESDSVALLIATGLLLVVYSVLLLLWMQVYGIMLDCDRGFQYLNANLSTKQQHHKRKGSDGAMSSSTYTVGSSRHCVSVFWIAEVLSNVLSARPYRTATMTTTRIINGKRITSPHQPAPPSESSLRSFIRKIVAVGIWVGLETAYHFTMLLEHILRLRTVVVTAAQMLFCFHGISAFLFERPEGKFGLSPVDFWLWKVAAVASCALWHLVALPTSPQWERGARVVGYIALFTIFVRFSNFSSIVSLEWKEDELMSTATFLPMKQPHASSTTTGSMSSHKLSLPFTSSLLISSLVLSLGFDSGRSIVLDPAIVSSYTINTPGTVLGSKTSFSSSASYATLRRAIWSATLRAQIITMIFVSVISILAFTSVNHGYGGHTMLTNVIVKVSNLVRTSTPQTTDDNGDTLAFTTATSQYNPENVMRQFWSVMAQLTCLIAFTAMVPGLINTCKKQIVLLNLSLSRLYSLRWRQRGIGGADDDVAQTLLLLTSEPPTTATADVASTVSNTQASSARSANKKSKKLTKQQQVDSSQTTLIPVSIGVAILALIPTFFNNSPYGFEPVESNVGAALPSARALLRTVNTYFSYNWVMLLFAVSILVEFVVPALAGVAFSLSASEGALMSIASSSAPPCNKEEMKNTSRSKKNRLFNLRLKQFGISLASLVASTILLFLTVLYL